MNTQIIQKFNVIGISVRTTNENGQAVQDIPGLWDKFMKEGIVGRIPGKIDDTIYCVYTEYEKDHTKPYTTLLGCSVSTLDDIPAGMVGLAIDGANYIKYIGKGNILQGMVFAEWQKIWNSDLPRTFTADFEVYGVKAQNPVEAEVEIFVAVK